MDVTSFRKFDVDDITIQDRIVAGNIPVYKAAIATKEKPIAVKRMECARNEIPREIWGYGKLLPHPNVLPLLGVAHSKEGFNIFICMELADKSLYQYLHLEKKTPSLQQSINWAQQIAKGVQHLHHSKLAHCNLKSTNVLLFEREDITKVCDFHSGQPRGHTTTVSDTTSIHRWMAPECKGKLPIAASQRCDIFSYGMILYEIFARKIPFANTDEGIEVITQIRSGKRPSIPREVLPYIKQVIESCWKQEPQDRPTFENILKTLDAPPTSEEQPRDTSPPMSNLPLSYVDLDDIDLEERIGRGNVSVYRATMAGKPIAVKRMECEKNQVPHEVEVHSKLPSHPNILPLLGITHSTDGFNVYICMELAEKSLHQFLHKERNEPSPQQSTKWAIQIAQGMYHLHQNGLAHRDLKSGNILLFEDGKTVKICDFGSARPLERTNTMTGMTGTGRWMAPEFNDKANTKVNQRCDVFSYGMVLYELFAHELPFSDTHELVDIVSKIRAGERPQLQKKIPLHIKELTESCWKQYPRDRPTFESILVDHLYVADGDNQEVNSWADLASTTEMRSVLLVKAAGNGDTHLVEKLLQRGVNINYQDKFGHTALYSASWKGRVQVIRLLLQEKADITIPNAKGVTALDRAKAAGHTDVVNLLQQQKS